MLNRKMRNEMRRVIFKCLRTMLVCVGMCVSGGVVVYGQDTIEQQKDEFDKGNRDSRFLKEYVDALKTKGQVDGLGRVLDCYLMSLPFELRYTSDNIADFITYVNGGEAQSLLDVVKNWGKLSLTDEQKKAIVGKIDQMCPIAVFTWFTAKEKNPDLKMPDFSLLQESLSNSTIPVTTSKRALINMWQSYCKKDISGIIDGMKMLFSSPIELNGILDWMLFGNIGNYLLEESDLAQCKEVITIMTKALADHDKKEELLTVEKLKEDFVGRSMMLEMGEE